MLLLMSLSTAAWRSVRYDKLENVDKDDWLKEPTAISLKAKWEIF